MIRHNILHIFTPYGVTYTFKHVNILCDNESVIEFDYRAQSDCKMKRGTFYKKNIVGCSVEGGLNDLD